MNVVINFQMQFPMFSETHSSRWKKPPLNHFSNTVVHVSCRCVKPAVAAIERQTAMQWRPTPSPEVSHYSPEPSPHHSTHIQHHPSLAPPGHIITPQQSPSAQVWGVGGEDWGYQSITAQTTHCDHNHARHCHHLLYM